MISFLRPPWFASFHSKTIADIIGRSPTTKSRNSDFVGSQRKPWAQPLPVHATLDRQFLFLLLAWFASVDHLPRRTFQSIICLFRASALEVNLPCTAQQYEYQKLSVSITPHHSSIFSHLQVQCIHIYCMCWRSCDHVRNAVLYSTSCVPHTHCCWASVNK